MSTPTDVLVLAVVPAPWGPIHLAATGRGLVALELMSPTEVFVARLERRLRREIRPGANPMLDLGVAQIEEFLDGRRRTFDVPIEIDDRPAWDRDVLAAVRGTGWGRVTSYGEVARRIGRPGAARAVGGAVGRNPIGLVIPCHRVIAGDGSLGGYGGGWFGSREELLRLKRELLAREGVAVPLPGD